MRNAMRPPSTRVVTSRRPSLGGGEEEEEEEKKSVPSPRKGSQWRDRIIYQSDPMPSPSEDDRISSHRRPSDDEMHENGMMFTSLPETDIT